MEQAPGTKAAQVADYQRYDSDVRAALGSPAGRAALGAGGGVLPLLTREPAGVARWTMRQSKALKENFQRHFKNFLKRALVRSRSGQRSKPLIFDLSVTKTGLIKAAYPYFARG